MTTTAGEKLRRWERWALGGLFAVVVAFGVVVEVRAACLSRRMGDLGVFLRAAWAVRSGENLYDITCDNRWHYNYPPLFAILLIPFADPPGGYSEHAGLPYAASVAVFYVLSVLSLAAAVHLLASALEATTGDGARAWGSRRWWYLRVAPVLACLPPIGHSLARGQPNLFLLLLLCGMTAALLYRRGRTAGWCLAGAICLKIIPAYLLVYPLWRRDGRCLAGCAAGLVAGLLLIPGAVLGPERTAESFRDLARVLIAPALGVGTDVTRAEELTTVTATNNQSFQAMIHHALHPDPVRRPKDAASPVRLAHWLLGGALTLATLLAARRAGADGPAEALALGALILVNLLVSPVCHTHYFVLGVPLVMALMVAGWQREAAGGPTFRFLTLPVSAGLFGLSAVQVVANVLPLLPGLELLRELGLAGYATAALWLAGCLALGRRGAAPAIAAPVRAAA